jgi:hypothetical protein
MRYCNVGCELSLHATPIYGLHRKELPSNYYITSQGADPSAGRVRMTGDEVWEWNGLTISTLIHDEIIVYNF